MPRFFTSDPHFRHQAVITKMNRGEGRFASIEDHDAHLIDQINKLVKRGDELYMLGDYAWADHSAIRMQINCRHIKICLGNHDKFGKLRGIFGEAPHVRELKSFGDRGQTCFMSHYPHAYWSRSHYGSYHLYGHMHMKREADLDKMMPERKSMDVGVDNAFRLLGEFRPFSEGEVLHFLDKKGHDPLEFYRGASTIEP